MKVSVITPSIRPEGLKIVQDCLKKQTFTDFEWIVELGLGTKHDLNSALNRAIRRSTGDIIVFYQDFISVPDTFLENIVRHGNLGSFTTIPVGKVDSFTESAIRWDWRNEHDSGEITHNGWEIDLGFCPREALVKIGGFDEELDGHWSCDNLNVAYRAALGFYKFELFRETHGIALDHDKFIKHPFRANYDPNFNNNRCREFDGGLKLRYLDSN